MEQTVYIVDDDESVRRALRRLVLANGLKAEVFSMAEEFLRSPRQAEKCCLVVDLHLPGLDGLELQKQLAAQDRRLPTIFITAHVDARKRDSALSAGAIAFLEKPFNEKTLLRAIEEALAQEKARPTVPGHQ
jgi:FixJ family two-component response regulator